MAIYRFTELCIDQRDGLCLHLYTAAYLEFYAMFAAYVRFKCNYAALRKSSDNQQQHLLLGKLWIIGNMM